jgi:hypothetical protein
MNLRDRVIVGGYHRNRGIGMRVGVPVRGRVPVPMRTGHLSRVRLVNGIREPKDRDKVNNNSSSSSSSSSSNRAISNRTITRLDRITTRSDETGLSSKAEEETEL